MLEIDAVVTTERLAGGIGLLPALACKGSDAVRFAEIAAPAPPQRHIDALARRAAARRPALAAALEALKSAAQARPAH